MTVWFGGVDLSGRALSDAILKRMRSDEVDLFLTVEAGELWLKSEPGALEFTVRRDCVIKSIGIFPTRHSMEHVYDPTMFDSGAKTVRTGDRVNVSFAMRLINDNSPRRENIDLFREFLR